MFLKRGCIGNKILTLIVLCLLSLSSIVFAQEGSIPLGDLDTSLDTSSLTEGLVSPEDLPLPEEFDAEFVDAGVTPDSFFYFFETFWEGTQLAFTVDPEQEALLHAEFADERFAEMQQMVEEGNYEVVNGLSEDVKEDLESVEQYVLQLEASGENLDTLHEFERVSILHDEYAEQVDQSWTIVFGETLDIGDEGEDSDVYSEETANEITLNLNEVRLGLSDVNVAVAEKEEEITVAIAEEQGTTLTEAALFVENQAQQAGVTELQNNQLTEELEDAREQLNALEKELNEAQEEGAEIPNEVALHELLDEAGIKLAISADSYGDADYGEAYGQFVAAEYLIDNTNYLLQGMSQGLYQGLSQGISQGLSQGIAQGLSQGLSQGLTQGITETVTELKESVDEDEAERVEEHEDYVEEYESNKEEWETKYPELSEEFEQEYEQSQDALELSQKLDELYSTEFDRLQLEGKSEEEANEVISEKFAMEYEHVYGEPYLPPALEEDSEEFRKGVVDEVEAEGVYLENYEYTDPVTEYKYEFSEEGYTYTTPAGLVYEEEYPEGYEPAKAYNKGDESYTYTVETPEGEVEYTYYPTGYQVETPEGEIETVSYPEGAYNAIGGGRFEYTATGFEYSEGGKIITYEYHPEFDTYVSTVGSVYNPPEGAYLHDAVTYESDKKDYTYVTSEGETWTYDAGTGSWTSSTGQTYAPQTGIVAPVSYEEQGSYTTPSGETWTYDAESKVWTSSGGEQYKPETHEYATAPGAAYNYDPAQNTYTTKDSTTGDSTTWNYDSSTGAWTTTSSEGKTIVSTGTYEYGPSGYTYDSSASTWKSSTSGDTWTYDAGTGSWTSSTGQSYTGGSTEYTYTPATGTSDWSYNDAEGTWTSTTGDDWSYDSSTGTWTSSSGQTYTGSTSTTGGTSGWSYDSSTDTWTSSTGETTTTYGDYSTSYTGGSYSTTTTTSSDSWSYDSSTGTWSSSTGASYSPTSGYTSGSTDSGSYSGGTYSGGDSGSYSGGSSPSGGGDSGGGAPSGGGDSGGSPGGYAVADVESEEYGDSSVEEENWFVRVVQWFIKYH